MLGSYTVKHEFRDAFCGVIHADGTVRAQILDEEDPQSQYLARILHELAGKYDVPGLIQTSFNAKGMPLVQTSEDAFSTGTRIGLDEVIIE